MNTTNRISATIVALLAGAALVGAGCGQDLGEPNGIDGDVETESRAVVTPEFRVAGGDRMPEGFEEKLRERFDLRLRLDPVDSVETSSRTASSVLSLDESRASEARTDGRLEVPSAGRYDLDVQLMVAGPEAAEDGRNPGRERNSHLLIRNAESEGDDEGDGNPLPLPAAMPDQEYGEDDEPPAGWWRYAATGDPIWSGEFTAVDLRPGSHELVVRFEPDQWDGDSVAGESDDGEKARAERAEEYDRVFREAISVDLRDD